MCVRVCVYTCDVAKAMAGVDREERERMKKEHTDEKVESSNVESLSVRHNEHTTHSP